MDPGRITVTPLGVSIATPVDEPRVPVVGAPFLLYVGDRVPPYKNFRRLLEAMTHETVPSDLRLVCCGPASRSEDEAVLLAELDLESRVEFRSGLRCRARGAVPERDGARLPLDLRGLRSAAIGGDGQRLPGRGLRCGVDPEVVGDAAAMFDPFDVDAMAKVISTVVDDPTVRQDLVERGRRRAASFTWDSTVEKTLAVYRQVAGAPT